MEKQTQTDNKKSISGKGITENVGIFQSESKLAALKHGLLPKLLLVVGVVVLAVFAFTQFIPQKNLCDDVLMQEVRSSIRGSRPAQLHDIANNVKTKDGYKENINCMFIVAKDNLKQGEVAEGIKNYQKVADLHEAGNKFSSKLGSDKEVKAEFERDTAFLKKLQKESSTNNSGVIQR